MKKRSSHQRRVQFERANPQRFQTPVSDSGLSPRQFYRAQGWDQGGEEHNNAPEQGVLFEHPHGLANPPRWEDLKPHQQKRLQSRLSSQYGVTYDSAKRAYAAQLDRAMEEEEGKHTSFYSAEGEAQGGGPVPRQVLKNTVRDTSTRKILRTGEVTGRQTPFHEVVLAHSITSPQVNFVDRNALGGLVHPNDQGARAVLRHAAAGKSGDDYMAGRRIGPAPTTVLPENIAKGINMLTDARNANIPYRDSPHLGDAPKVRAYHNALLDPTSPEGNYYVSDRHSGVGAMAPHLAGDKATAEAYMKVAGVHAFHDKVVRDVLAERGLYGQVNRGQSAQWSQAKAEKGQVRNVMDVTPATPREDRHMNPNQAALFELPESGRF